MTDLEAFKGLVNHLRSVAETTRSRYEHLSPLALVMVREQDGQVHQFLKGLYIAGGFEVMPRAIEEALAGGCTPIGLVEALDDIVRFHEQTSADA